MHHGTVTRLRRLSIQLRPRLGTPLRALALAATMAACGGDGGTNPNSLGAIAGTYDLISFDGRAVPTVTFEDAEWRDEVLSERLILEADGTFMNAYSWKYTHKPTGAVEADEGLDEGTFTRDAQELLLLYEGQSNAVIARLSGDRITIRTQTGAPFVYERR